MLLSNRSFFAVIVVLFLLQSGYGVLLPTLPFLAERLMRSNGADIGNLPLHVGLLTALYPTSQILTSAFWGKISDRIGRKPLILLGISGFILMQGFTGLVTTISGLYIVLTLGSLLSSFSVPAIIAFISDITSHKDRRLAMAWSGAAVSAGVVSGPAITGLLVFHALHLRTGFGHFEFDRYSLPFLVLAVFGIVAFVIAAAGVREQRTGGNDEVHEHVAPTRSSRSFVYVLTLSFLAQWALTSFESSFSLFGKNELALSPTGLGIGFVVCGVVMAVAQPLLASLRKSDASLRSGVKAGFSLISLALLSIPWVRTPAMAYGLIAVLSVGFGFIIPILVSSATLERSHEVGKAVGIVFTVNALGQVAGPLTGTLGYAVNWAVPFLIAGIVAGLAAMFQPRLAFATSTTYKRAM